MLFILAFLTLLVSINAHFSNYGYGYNNYGYKKAHLNPYHSNSYFPPEDRGYKGYGYGYQEGYRQPHDNYYQFRKRFHVKLLPPIYKDIEQPVYVKQPVIIRKIPVIHKTKQVTVKHQPPIYNVMKPTVIEKDVSHSIDKMPIIPDMSVDIPKTDFEDMHVMNPIEKGVKDEKDMIDVKEMIDTKEMTDTKDMIDMKDMDVKPEGEGNEDYDLDKRMKGFDEKDIMSMINKKENKENEYDLKDFET